MTPQETAGRPQPPISDSNIAIKLSKLFSNMFGDENGNLDSSKHVLQDKQVRDLLWQGATQDRLNQEWIDALTKQRNETIKRLKLSEADMPLPDWMKK